jgi:hypothetical protein
MWHTLGDGSDCLAAGFSTGDARLLATAKR